MKPGHRVSLFGAWALALLILAAPGGLVLLGGYSLFKRYFKRASRAAS